MSLSAACHCNCAGRWLLSLVVGLSVLQTTAAAHAARPSQAQLVAVGEILIHPAETFVITHGYGGTKEGDRFDRLAQAIKKRNPDANVFRLDWSRASQATLWGNLPNPWLVAQNIDSTGEVAAALIRQQVADPSTLTLLGESFGVFVNHRIAVRLGKVAKVLAFNPANEVGGYMPPNLENDAQHVYVFSSSSMFDTQLSLGGISIQLPIDPTMDPYEQHVFGITWMGMQLERHDPTWLELAANTDSADLVHLRGGF